MKKAVAFVNAMNGALGWIAGLCIAAAAVLIIVEVAGRPLWGSLQVTDEYTGYLMAISSMLGLGYVEKVHGHIRMGLIFLLKTRYPRFIHCMRLWAYGMACIFAGYLTVVSWRLFAQSYEIGSVSMQISETPLAIPQLFLPLGAAALLLQYLCNLYMYCRGQSEE